MSDFNSEAKELQLEYIKHLIRKLGYKQLSESILDIKDITRESAHLTCTLELPEEMKHTQPRYKLTFDKALQIEPIIVDFLTIKELEKHRKQLYFNDKMLTPKLNNTTDSNTQQPLKQITSLLSKEALERNFDPTLHGICHHCKCIALEFDLFRCKDVKSRSVKKRMIGKRNETHKRFRKRILCPFVFCSSCIRDHYEKPIKSASDPKWLCPFCLVCFFRYPRVSVIVQGVRGKNAY